MGLIDALKWMWDPLAEEDIRRNDKPLRRYKQDFKVYIKGIDTPFDRYVEFEDSVVADWEFRIDLDDEVRDWLNCRAKKGVIIDKTWYAPDMIERIEIGEVVTEPLKA